jgi:hypothetical protein
MEKRSTVHPCPNVNRSWFTLTRPQPVSVFIAQALASASAGEPVTRGPYTSLSHPR